jgi:hypothetical protein
VVFLAAVVPICVLIASCNDDPVSPPQAGPDLSTPEGVVEELGVAYRARDRDAYADLLATDFRFFFQPVDQAENGEFWDRDQDMLGTGALFGADEVSTIRVDLGHGPAQAPTEVGFDPDVMKIRLTTVNLEVDLKQGVTLLVHDLQDLYLRPGREALAEDPEHWYLLEWHDLSAAGAPKPQVLSTTWGLLKSAWN